jgi:hypothetical protein
MNELEFRLILTADNRRLIRGIRGASESIDITSASAEELEAAIRAAMTADQRDLVRRIDDVDSSLESSAESAVAMGSALTAALTGGTAAAIVALVRSTASAAKEMRNMANVANEGYEEFQALAFATGSVGIEAEQLADISKDTREKLGEFASTGGGGFADFFDQVAPAIGMTADELQGLSGPDALIAVKNAMDAANVSSEQQIFYLESIASDASLLIPLLADNGAQLHAMAAEGRALGVVLSEVESESLFEAATASKRLDAAIDGISKRFAIKFAPAVASVSNLIADLVASGALESYLTSLSDRFDVFAEDAAATLGIVTQFIDTSLNEWGSNAEEASNFFGDAFSNLPENARAMIQLMVVELASMVDYGSAYGKAFAQSLGVEIAALIDRAKIYGQELADALNPLDGDSFDMEAALAQSNAAAIDMIDGFYAQAEASASAARQARLASIQDILNERDESVSSFESQADSAVVLLDEYRKLREARRQAAAAGTAANDPVIGKPAVESVKERRERELLEAQGFDSIEERDEAAHQDKLAQIKEQVVLDSVNKRREAELLTVQGFNSVEERDEAAHQDKLAQIKDQAVLDSVNKRRETELLTAQGYRSKEERDEAEHQQRLTEIKRQAQEQQFAQASDFFANIGQIAAAASGKQSKAYKVAAIARATINTYEAATGAYASLAPIPVVGPALGIAAAAAAVTAGLANVRTIASQNVSGIAHGGLTNVPAESTYVLQKGERVLSPNQNKDFTNFISTAANDSNGGKGNVYVTVHNNVAGTEATTTETTNGLDRYIEVIIDKAHRRVAQDISQGGGLVSQAGEARYNWRRGVA